MGVGTLINDRMHKGKNRKGEWDALVQRYPSLAPTAEDYNRGMDEYMRTGQMPTGLPTGREVRTDITPRVDTEDAAGVPMTIFPTTEVKPERKPIRLAPGVTLLNKETGEARELSDVPAGNQILTFDPTVSKSQGATLHVLDASGKVIRTVPWKGNTDHVVTLSREPMDRGAGRAPAETPQQKAARQTLAEYDRGLKGGRGVSPELEDRAAEAARFLGLPTEKVVNKPGFFGRLIGREETSFERPSFGAPSSAPAPAAPPPASSSKDLSRDQALEFLRQAGGDRDKAREMARQAGYRF